MSRARGPSLIAGSDEAPEGVHPTNKASRISSPGDVVALAALACGGVVGLALLPAILGVRCVRGLYQAGKKICSKDPVLDPDMAQDCDGIWPFSEKPGGGGAQQFPEGTKRLAGYVKMSDGVRIAVDVLLPPCAQGADGTFHPVPCVVHMARYWRAWEMRWPIRELLNRGEPWDFLLGPWKSALLESGFAVVSADVRGAGASGGVQSVVWSPRETQDTLELIDFIVGVNQPAGRQPWSDGQVALFGVSYDAGAAVRAAAHKHPAVKAVVASFLFGDIWRELFPGGIMNRWFLQSWCNVNSRLDNARLAAIHPFSPLIMKGAAPASSRKQLSRCVSEHRGNWDLMSAAGSIKAIDDPVAIGSGETMTCQNLELFANPLPSLDEPRQSFFYSMSQGKAVLPALAASQLPTLLISGWACVTSGTACAAFSALAGQHWRLLLGPWNHGGVQHVRYCRETKLLKFPKAKAVQEFLLYHMPRQGFAQSSVPAWLASPKPEVHFYVCGASPAWQHSTEWPPKNVVKKQLWLSTSQLTWTKDDLEHEGSTQLPKATDLVRYKWKASAVAKGRALLFETSVCPTTLAVIGSAVLTLRLRSSKDQDADIFAYLRERPPDGGDLVYITEGALRLSYRREEEAPDHEKAADPHSSDSSMASFGVVPHHSYRRQDIQMLPAEGETTTARLKFFPVAYRFRAGSKIALVIAPDDAAHYAPNPLAGPHPPFICHSTSEQSMLWLPIKEQQLSL
ncbi:unnamed protein product [Durusdinium trenchii]|uniref:Xaa-Pro dipeptidyl-peptidase C-terminal domain-containing protein n=2 Tax=Durusdinium trenchii TaxID=1381693 RepID=A0ABP0NU17_9DINO